MSEKEKEIIAVLEKIRPYIQRDGGDLEFVSFKDGIVTIKMLGACSDCLALDDTISMGVEALLLEEVEGVVGVQVAQAY
ncbi:NifU family protein [Traorella massiliensis]|uniref:NifU family protein n=1 Tax=Traorella massiliensis TaxID=1903263 RepID=UPI0008F96F63|nr:NifU family protein [Traorella massiliensis]